MTYEEKKCLAAAGKSALEAVIVLEDLSEKLANLPIKRGLCSSHFLSRIKGIINDCNKISDIAAQRIGK